MTRLLVNRPKVVVRQIPTRQVKVGISANLGALAWGQP